MLSVPDILPSVKFPQIGNSSCFPCFSWEKKKKEIWKNGCSEDKDGPKLRVHVSCTFLVLYLIPGLLLVFFFQLLIAI